METQAMQPSSDSTAAGADPRWVMLDPYRQDEDKKSSSPADAKTVAASRTTTGHPIRISFFLAPPPVLSHFCVRFPDGAERKTYATALAAHGDSVLLRIVFEEAYDDYTTDHFVYNAGAAAADPPRPPSLSLLPPYYLTEEEKKKYMFRRKGQPMHRRLDDKATGLLRRGEDKLVVAELKIVKDTKMRKAAELLLLRNGEWSIKRPSIRHGDKEGGGLPSSWRTDNVIPIGDRLLCWVDLLLGVMFSDVFQENPELRYVWLPVKSYFGRASYRNVCVTAAGGAVKFVDIFPRCCGGDGDAGASYCRRSHRAYTIKTWMLRMDDMTWVMDGMVDATELWALDGLKGIPRVRMEYPVVSMDDPHAICFLVCHDNHVEHGDETVWMVMVDMRSKTLQSLYCYPEGGHWNILGKTVISSRVSCYFNSYPNMLKAYSILSNDNGRRFKTLLGLPMNLRKDWLLMEIKASET